MQLADLSTVSHQIRVGAPLPFNVRDSDKTLLLARGQFIRDAQHLQALLTRGALVDLMEVAVNAEVQIRHAQKHELPALWQQCLSHVNLTLGQGGDSGFRAALDSASGPVVALVARDPDLAIFHMLRSGNPDAEYGKKRSLHAAITAWLVAQRLGWEADESLKAFKVALTMNLSMLELQGQLARQSRPLDDEQRNALTTHPARSAHMLQAAGVTDTDWLRAVLDHHEQEDGSGYPSGTRSVGDLASLARRADVYTAKLTARAYRDSVSADVAGRQMFMQDPGHPMTAALVKEFGIYPPGCHVRLASGELAIVVSRGPTITTPVVACLTNERGMPLPVPVRRQTTDRRHAVEAVVGQRSLNVQVTAEKLMALGVV
jgi:HD-GYP domain-containing protein (c-di-GMP phosphodiesterase class II)